MSTLAYAALTEKREQSDPDESSSVEPPGTRAYVDVFVALVPAEVLALHAYLVGLVTKTTPGSNGGVPAVTVNDRIALKWFFWALMATTVVLYIARHARSWDLPDFGRMLIPPLAFVGWTMTQHMSAFDAVGGGWSAAARYGVPAFGAIVLSILVVALSYQADKKVPPRRQQASDRVAAVRAATLTSKAGGRNGGKGGRATPRA